jgi:hypothetical protein
MIPDSSCFMVGGFGEAQNYFRSIMVHRGESPFLESVFLAGRARNRGKLSESRITRIKGFRRFLYQVK